MLKEVEIFGHSRTGGYGELEAEIPTQLGPAELSSHRILSSYGD